MKKIKFAVVGCGHIGKRHAEMIGRDTGAELVALCDILPKEQLNIDQYEVPFFTSVDELLNSTIDIDVINICTPNGYHAPLAIQALETNHHIVIEKPMALTTSDAETVLHTALMKGKQIFGVFGNVNRFSIQMYF